MNKDGPLDGKIVQGKDDNAKIDDKLEGSKT